MADGQVVIEITADNRQAVQAAQDTSNSITNSFGGMFKTLSLTAAAATVGKTLLEWGKAAVEAASELQEVQNVVDVTFGDSANEIESWAKNARDQFGLTETQAKKFASTLGATMKSQGLAGDEIVEMSENLSGLAADMASFYNLDFETAFQKIRSGISGETEPLKQLGINMSVANLEAFALTQGITKAFDKMSQSEQTQLRYQYLMQATADAQGDFARTSDGYANSMRKLETAIETVKTKMGAPFLNTIADATNSLTELIDVLYPEDRSTKTILNDFAGIDAQTKKELAETERSYRIVIEAIEELEKLDENGEAVLKVSNFADGINKLDSTSPTNWQTVLGSFSRYKDVASIWGETDAPEKVKELASALSGEQGAQAKAQAIDTLLQALKDNADGIAKYGGMNKENVLGIIGGLEEKAKNLKPDDLKGWNDWFTLLADSFPGLMTSTDFAGLKQVIGDIAVESGNIRATSVSNWEHFAGALKQVGGIREADVQSIKDLSEALGSEDVDANKAGAWQTMLSTLGQNAEAIGKIRGTNAEEASNWLKSIATSANMLDASDTDGWNQLFTILLEGLPGLSETEEGKEFFAAIEANANAAANSTNAVANSEAVMGNAADSASAKQAELLRVIKEQARYFPGLNDLIDANTGELRGGTQAIREYMEEWRKIRDNDSNFKNLRSKYQALQKWNDELALTEAENKTRYSALSPEGQGMIGRFSGDYAQQKAQYEMLMNIAKKQAEQAVKHPEFGKTYAFASRNDYANYGFTQEEHDLIVGLQNTIRNPFADSTNAMALIKEVGEAQSAVYDYIVQVDALDKANTSFADDVEKSVYTMDDVTGAAEDAAEALAEETEAEKEAMRELLKTADEAMQAVIDYYNNVRTSVAQSVSNVVGGFHEAITKSDEELRELKKNRDRLDAEIKAEKNKKEKDKKIKKLQEVDIKIETISGERPSAQKMINNLQSQLNFMSEYQSLMDKARQNNVSEDVLAQLADGSTESMEYLRALSQASEGEVADINRLYGEVGEQKKTFIDNLTEQKLAVDNVWNGLVDDASSALTALASKDKDAFNAADGLIGNFIDGLKNRKEELNKEILSVTTKIGMLTTLGKGFNFQFGVNGVPAIKLLPKHKNGLDYVPFDGYTAQLHEGESILTKEEARIWRGYMEGNSNFLSGAIWNNAPDMGGNVYLDGQIVGNVVSARQGRQFRRLERSGWRG
jgi:hypothetical protein